MRKFYSSVLILQLILAVSIFQKCVSQTVLTVPSVTQVSPTSGNAKTCGEVSFTFQVNGAAT